jgi:CheY-like chemotaxis protein
VNGFEIARKIRAHPPFDSMVLVAQSGMCDIGTVLAAEEIGFDFFLPKPYDLKDVGSLLYIERPEHLILLSETLIERSHELQTRSHYISIRAEAARKRSDQLRKRLGIPE